MSRVLARRIVQFVHLLTLNYLKVKSILTGKLFVTSCWCRVDGRFYTLPSPMLLFYYAFCRVHCQLASKMQQNSLRMRMQTSTRSERRCLGFVGLCTPLLFDSLNSSGEKATNRRHSTMCYILYLTATLGALGGATHRVASR